MAFDCPGCMAILPNGATGCGECGWSKRGAAKGPQKYIPTRETCPKCSRQGWARNYNDDGPDKLTPAWVQRPDGSDYLQGWYHSRCRAPQTDLARRVDKLIADAMAGGTSESHTAIRAMSGQQSKSDRREALSYVRRMLGRMAGALPYDKAGRVG